MSGSEYFITRQESQGLKRQAIRGAGATVFAQSSNYLIQMVGTVVLARLLTPDDFGMMTMVTTFSILFMNFGTRGFTEATVQSQNLTHEKVSALFWLHILLSVLLMVIFVGGAPILSWFYHEPRLTLIAAAMSLTFILYALSTQHQALMMRSMEFFNITKIQIGANIASVALAISLAAFGASYWSLVARRVALPLSMVVGAWILCSWRPGRPRRGAEVRSMVHFGMNTYGNFTLNYMSRNLDKILIGWRYGTQSLGYYDRAYYLFVMPVNQLAYPLTNVAVATLSRLRSNPGQFRDYYLKAVFILSFAGMLISAILTLVGQDLVYVLLGPQWTKAGLIFTVFGPAIGIIIVYGTHGWLHLSLGRADRWLRWGILELIITVGAFIAGLPFGGIGVAAAYVISIYLLIIPGLIYAGKPVNLGAGSIVSIMWRPIIAALAAGSACWYLMYSSSAVWGSFQFLNVFYRIVIASGLCSILYILGTVVLYGSIRPLTELVSVLKEFMPQKAANKQP